MSVTIEPVRFTQDDAQAAREAWGMNCGPGAAAAILRMTPEEIRPHFDAIGFPAKRYTNPSMMFALLRRLAPGRWEARRTTCPLAPFPIYGLARIQWGGPWMAPGVPPRARYRHTHWVGARTRNGGPGEYIQIFDINAISVGGWIPIQQWDDDLVPWLLEGCEPKADGRWSITHAIEVLP